MQNNRFSGFSKRKKNAAAKQIVPQAHALEVTTPGQRQTQGHIRSSEPQRPFPNPDDRRRRQRRRRRARQKGSKTNSTQSSTRPSAALVFWKTNTRATRTSCSSAHRRRRQSSSQPIPAPSPTLSLSAPFPRGCVPDGVVERHFVGANDAHIETYGGCDTLMTTREGQLACKYQVADVARTLH